MTRLVRLLRPRSLAFIGGAAAELAIDASRSFGFSGDMWAVNRSRELRGMPTFASVSELPAGVDAAFVGVGRDASVEVVRQLAAAGTGAVICHASGFAETGEAGAALQAEAGRRGCRHAHSRAQLLRDAVRSDRRGIMARRPRVGPLRSRHRSAEPRAATSLSASPCSGGAWTSPG